MSEYQYYEWQAVDRRLTEDEQKAVQGLSSHIEVSPSSAVVTYSWGDFKHDPEEVLVRYFDAHLYLANWGSHRLMFRFPKDLVDHQAVALYCIDDILQLSTEGKYRVLDVRWDEEEGGDWVEGEGLLSSFVPLRENILRGDYRMLYLAWLKGVDSGAIENKQRRQLEPPVPAGLKNLSPALERFVEWFEIDKCLIEAAVEASPELAPSQNVDFRPLIARLSRQECDDFLARLARGEPAVGLELNKRLLAFVDRQPVPSVDRRTIGQLLEKASALKDRNKRQAQEAARKKHAAEMEYLAGHEEEIWQHIETLIGMKLPKHYDQAVEQMAKLKTLHDGQKAQSVFREKLDALLERHRNKPSLKDRIRRASLLDGDTDSATTQHADIHAQSAEG